MGQVSLNKTSLGMEEVIRILPWAFKEATGVEINGALPYLLTLVHLENDGGRAIYNYNWGNVIVNKDSEDYFYFNNNPRHFKSNNSHEDGAIYYVKRLMSPTNRRMVEAALNDDFEAFVSGYYDLNPKTKKAYNFIEDESYKAKVKNSFLNLVNQYKKMLYEDVPSTIRPPSVKKKSKLQ